MEICIPVVSAAIVYCYNYRKLLKVREEIIKIHIKMSDKDVWDKLDGIVEKLHELELKVNSLEVKLAMYSGAAIFISTIASSILVKIIQV